MSKQLLSLAEEIHIAIGRNRLGVARRLLDKAEQSNLTEAVLLQQDRTGQLPIHLAIERKLIRTRHPEFIKLLACKCPKSLLKSDGKNGDLPIHMVLRKEAMALACDLLDVCNKDPELSGCVLQPNKQGKLPIHMAVERWRIYPTESVNLVQSLVRMDWNKMTLLKGDLDGNLPIHLAIQGSAVEIARVLLNADKTKKSILEHNDGGRLPLHLAVDRHLTFRLDLVKLLVDADLTNTTVLAPDDQGNLPIHALLEKQGNQGEALRLLLDADVHGLSVRQRGRRGKLPIQMAIKRCSSLDTIRWLLATDKQQNKGLNKLATAAERTGEGNHLIRRCCRAFLGPPLVEVLKLLVKHYNCEKNVLVKELGSASFRVFHANFVSSKELKLLLEFSLDERIKMLPAASRKIIEKRIRGFHNCGMSQRQVELGQIMGCLKHLERKEQVCLLKLAAWKVALQQNHQQSQHTLSTRKICLITSGADQIASLVEEFML